MSVGLGSTFKDLIDEINSKKSTAVSFTPSATSGNKVGTIKIDDVSTDMYAPTQTSVSGNAGTATKLATARTISLTGDITGSTTFDGSANKAIATTLAKKYWANLELSTSSNTNTAPKFSPEFTTNIGSGTVITPSAQKVLSSPIPKYSWHDLFAFGANSHPTVENSADGTTWTTNTDENLTKKLFISKENQTITVLSDSVKATRWTWTSSSFHACGAYYLLIGFAYTSPIATYDILFEVSTDNSTWTTGVTKTGVTYNQAPYWFYISSSWSSVKYARLTLTKTSDTGSLAISGIKLLTSRWGNQGQGSEKEKPYGWDTTPNLLPKVGSTSSLGTSSSKWKDGYFSGTVTAPTFSGNATSASKVNNALALQINGTTKATYNGSSAQTFNVTPSAIGAYTTSEVDSKISSNLSTAKTYSDTNLSTAKSYTDTKIANLINSAPETLDTLGEIADAIEENQEVVDTLNNAIANKADKSTLNNYSTLANTIKSLSISGKTITYAKGDSTTGTLTTQDTTYSAGTGLSLSGTTFNHKNSVTAGTAQGDATKTLTFGGTFTIPTVTYDAQGHITGKGTTTMTMPANPNTDTGATSVTVSGSGNAVTTASYDNSTRKLTLTKGTTFLTSHQDISGKTNTSVMPNNSGEIKTKFRCAQKGYTGGSSTIWYYPLCTFPTNNSGNYASAIVSGRIGGWASTNMSSVNALVWNRGTPGIATFDIAGDATAMSSIWNTADLVLYTNSTDGATATATATLYVKCVNYFTFDLDLELYQSTATIDYNGTYATTTPSGTLAAQASTTTKRVEIVNGKLLVNGEEMAKVSAIPTKISALTNDTGYVQLGGSPTPLTSGQIPIATGNNTVNTKGYFIYYDEQETPASPAKAIPTYDVVDAHFVDFTSDQLIRGKKTFLAPTNSSGIEQATTEFKIANGGNVKIGKVAANDNVAVILQKEDGTDTLQIRTSYNDGGCVWQQPQYGAQLTFDIGKSGSDYHRIYLPKQGGYLALGVKANNTTYTTNTNGIVDISSAIPTTTSELTNDSGYKSYFEDTSKTYIIIKGDSFGKKSQSMAVYSGDVTIDWGDGTVEGFGEHYDTFDIQHAYDEDTYHIISITDAKNIFWSHTPFDNEDGIIEIIFDASIDYDLTVNRGDPLILFSDTSTGNPNLKKITFLAENPPWLESSFYGATNLEKIIVPKSAIQDYNNTDGNYSFGVNVYKQYGSTDKIVYEVKDSSDATKYLYTIKYKGYNALNGPDYVLNFTANIVSSVKLDDEYGTVTTDGDTINTVLYNIYKGSNLRVVAVTGTYLNYEVERLILGGNITDSSILYIEGSDKYNKTLHDSQFTQTYLFVTVQEC